MGRTRSCECMVRGCCDNAVVSISSRRELHATDTGSHNRLLGRLRQRRVPRFPARGRAPQGPIAIARASRVPHCGATWYRGKTRHRAGIPLYPLTKLRVRRVRVNLRPLRVEGEGGYTRFRGRSIAARRSSCLVRTLGRTAIESTSEGRREALRR